MVTVSPAGVADRSAVARFLTRFPGESRDEAFWERRFRLWWDLNPACAEGAAGGWMACDGGEVVGFLGDVPTLLKVGEQIVTIHNGTTWRTLPSYRTRSIQLWYRMRRACTRSIIVVSAVGPMSQRLIDVARPSALPRSSDLRCLRALGGTAPAAPFLEAIGLAPHPAAESAPAADAPPASPDLVVTRLAAAGDEFDALWRATAGQYDCTNVRTADVVNWYCFADSGFAKTLLACHRGATLAGYLVGSVEARKGTRAWCVLDLWPGTAADDVVAALVAAAVDEARAAACDVVQLPVLAPSRTAALGPLGFVPYRETRHSGYYWAGSAFRGCFDGAACHLTDAQGDRGL